MQRTNPCTGKTLSACRVLDFVLGDKSASDGVRKRGSALDIQTHLPGFGVGESTSGASKSTYAAECASDNWDDQRNSLPHQDGLR